MKWHTEQRKIKDLIPFEYNPRTMTKKQNQELTDSIEKFDLVEIPAINMDGTILAGHQRLRVMGELGRGDEEVDVRVPDRLLTQKEAEEYLIRSNKNEGGWDFESLANNFDLPDLIEWGFEPVELNLPETEISTEDDVPTVESAPTRTKRGDVYQLGDHRLICGDSTLVGDVSEVMDGQLANLVFTDPPYNVDYKEKNEYLNKVDKGNSNTHGIQNDKMDDATFYAFLYDVFLNLALASENGAAAYICHADSQGLNFRKAFTEAGWDLKQCIIWVKNNHVLGRQDYQWKHEPILYGWKKGGTHYFTESRSHTTVWEFDKPQRSDDHPTMKPVELCSFAIENSTKPGDIVLDAFGGSGSTLIACQHLGRKCRMLELDERYCDVILARWENLTGETATLISK